jgi:hypothetical protein
MPSFSADLGQKSPVSPGHSNENLYRKVWRREGETLSVQCSYKNRRNLVEAKSWCKVKKKKCDHNFTRSWVRGPSYSLRDDAKVKVVRITMEALRVQDSGRYWCMRNTAGHFYPLVGFQLEVYPGEQTCAEPGRAGSWNNGSLLCTSSCHGFTDKENGFGQALCGSDLALGQSEAGTWDLGPYFVLYSYLNVIYSPSLEGVPGTVIYRL